jgi:hypothetical protein
MVMVALVVGLLTAAASPFRSAVTVAIVDIVVAN